MLQRWQETIQHHKFPARLHQVVVHEIVAVMVERILDEIRMIADLIGREKNILLRDQSHKTFLKCTSKFCNFIFLQELLIGPSSLSGFT
jgi:hypothetical protein